MSEETEMQVKVVCETVTNFQITIYIDYSDIQTYTEFIQKIYTSISSLGLGDINILLGEAHLKETRHTNEEEIFITELNSHNWEKILIQYFDSYVEENYMDNKYMDLFVLFKISEVEYATKLKKEISQSLLEIFLASTKISETVRANIDSSCIINNLSILKECKENLEKLKTDYILVKKRVEELKVPDSSISMLLEIVFEVVKDFESKTRRLEKSLKRTRISKILANL
jgi:hypothetical protein